MIEDGIKASEGILVSGGTGYQPVLSGNLPDSSCLARQNDKKPVGRLPTGTGKVARSTRKSNIRKHARN